MSAAVTANKSRKQGVDPLLLWFDSITLSEKAITECLGNNAISAPFIKCCLSDEDNNTAAHLQLFLFTPDVTYPRKKQESATASLTLGTYLQLQVVCSPLCLVVVLWVNRSLLLGDSRAEHNKWRMSPERKAGCS